MAVSKIKEGKWRAVRRCFRPQAQPQLATCPNTPNKKINNGEGQRKEVY
jgi:hypothetical protein